MNNYTIYSGLNPLFMAAQPDLIASLQSDVFRLNQKNQLLTTILIIVSVTISVAVVYYAVNNQNKIRISQDNNEKK